MYKKVIVTFQFGWELEGPIDRLSPLRRRFQADGQLMNLLDFSVSLDEFKETNGSVLMSTTIDVDIPGVLASA